MSLINTRVIIIILLGLVVVLSLPCIYGFKVAFIDQHMNVLTSLEISLIDSGKYDTIFQPVIALFSAIGIIFASITLMKQMRTSIMNNFNNQINMMTAMRTDIANTVIFSEQPDNYILEYKDYKVGKFVFSMLIDRIIIKGVMQKGGPIDIDNILYQDTSIELLKVFCKDGSEQCMEKFIYFVNKKIKDMTHGTLAPFFHNVYTTLKMIYENKNLTKNEKNEYIRMVRSHFSQPEFLLIYYHALTYADDEKRKFKKLIENTCFFHSLIQEGIPIKINEDIYPNLGYKLSAFYHPDEIKKMKEAQKGNNT